MKIKKKKKKKKKRWTWLTSIVIRLTVIKNTLISPWSETFLGGLVRPSSPDINLDPVYFSFFNLYIDLNYHHFIDKFFSSIAVHVDYV